MNTIANTPLDQYHVWDRTVRVFHRVNFICVTGLLAVGLVILNNFKNGREIARKSGAMNASGIVNWVNSKVQAS